MITAEKIYQTFTEAAHADFPEIQEAWNAFEAKFGEIEGADAADYLFYSGIKLGVDIWNELKVTFDRPRLTVETVYH